MKSQLFIIIILILLFNQCKQKELNFKEQLNKMSLEELKSYILTREMNKLTNSHNKILTPITLLEARRLVRNYIDTTAALYNIPKDTIPNTPDSIIRMDSIERSVEMPFCELLDAILDLRDNSGTPLCNYSYRIYFGRENKNRSLGYLTGHTAIVRICYNGYNLQDMIPNANDPANPIRTILNVGNICPPNCPFGLGLQTNDNTYHGSIE